VIGRDCISVVIVDDSSSVCDALSRLLNGDRGIECIASTGDGAEARRITDRLHPGIVLLDIEMPGVDTFALLRWIVSNHPWTKVLMISGYVLPALIERSLDLNETYDDGVIHSFLITYDMNRLKPKADRFDPGEAKTVEQKIANATVHYDRAMVLCGGRQAGPHVSYAESVLTVKKDRAGFEKALNTALKIDVNKAPDLRILNLVMQRRAKFLLARIDKYFPPAK